MSIVYLGTLWGPVFLWAGVIFYFSSIPNLNSGLGKWDWILRKGCHIGEYALLAGFLMRAIRGTWPLSNRRLVTLCLSLILVYAIADEFHQSFVPGRGMSARDVLIDVMSASLTILWYRAKHR